MKLTSISRSSRLAHGLKWTRAASGSPATHRQTSYCAGTIESRLSFRRLRRAPNGLNRQERQVRQVEQDQPMYFLGDLCILGGFIHSLTNSSLALGDPF